MVKAVMTEDYYGDLHVAPTADLAEIKKQFKKLALTYHPDRNPGRESEVTAQFQKISNAHEILCDAQERAKYDANRRPAGRYQTGGNQRGNPYSGVSNQFPKPPTRTNARHPPQPPPSAGAQRYKGFTTPKQSAYSASQEGPGARKSTYEAWENMKNQQHRPAPTAPKAHNVPPKGTSPHDQQETSGFKYPPSPRTRAHQEYRPHNPPPNASPNPGGRDPSFGSSTRRTGFTPNTPGADEAAAPKGTYFTARKSAEPPPPPPRPHPATTKHEVPVEPLRQFRDNKPNVQFDDRHSTPYATHGGEKLNPFENGDRIDSQDTTNLNRSKSTRETRNSTARNTSSASIPRAGSDSNLNSPNQQKPFHQRRATSKQSYKNSIETESSSSDGGPEINVNSRFTRDSRPYAKPRGTKTFLKPESTSQSASSPSTGHEASNGQTTSEQAKTRASNGEPSMYAQPSYQPPLASNSTQQSSQPRRPSGNRSSSFDIKLPTVSEKITSEDFFVPKVPVCSSSEATRSAPGVGFSLFEGKGGVPLAPPSGATGPRLFETEKQTYSVLDLLVSNKNKETSPFPKFDSDTPLMPGSFVEFDIPKRARVVSAHPLFGTPAMAGSPSKKQKSSDSDSSDEFLDAARSNWQPARGAKPKANLVHSSSFSIPVDETTFQRKPFTRNSTENINTKFTPDEWNGKFEGNGYFQPEQKAANMGQRPRTRTESGSRSRGRSPIKVRPIDPQYVQNQGEPQIPVESPSATKFSPEEWANTFKEQTFMPPPPPAKTPLRPTRKTRGSIPKPTMGGAAALVDESDSGDSKPLFAGRKSSLGRTPPSPDAMDVDTPPATKPATPSISHTVPQGLNPDPVSPQKRPAATSRAASPTDTELKVNFEDLSVRDIISSLNLPAAPTPPKILESVDTVARPSPDAYRNYLLAFEKYMAEWDLYTSRIILHLFARKNQNDGMGNRRWLEDGCLDTYRLGLREDKIVLNALTTSQERHSMTVKDHAILREKMKDRDAERPRKKQY